MFDVLQAIFWSITYILLIIYSIKNKKHAIPLIAICLNYSWEIVALFNNSGNLYDNIFFIHLSWFVLDTVIILLFLFYETNFKNNICKKILFLISLLFLSFTNTILFEMGYMLVTCFTIDLIMAVCFVCFICRVNLNKPFMFLLIGITKLFGDIFAWLEYKEYSAIVNIFGIIVLVLNIIYIFIVLLKIKKDLISMREYYYNRDKKKKRILLVGIPLFCILTILATLVTLGVIYNKEQNKIANIIVSSTPYDTEYYVGEELNTEGLSIQVLRNNKEFYFVDASKCDISGFDSSKPVERQIITVSYKGFICTFSVSIIELPKPVPVLKSIYIETLPKTEYKVGESLDTTGGVLVREYQDGSSARITLINWYVYGFDSSTPGTYNLTVMYYENGIMAQTTYEIVVSE